MKAPAGVCKILAMKIIFAISTAVALPFFVLVYVAIFVLLFFLVPQFEGIFMDFDTDLPGMTPMLMATSAFVINYWYAVLPIVILLVILLTVSPWLLAKLPALNKPGLLLLPPILFASLSVIGGCATVAAAGLAYPCFYAIWWLVMKTF